MFTFAGELNDLDGAGASAGGSNSEASKYQSADEKYIAVMTDLQFGEFNITREEWCSYLGLNKLAEMQAQ